MANVWSTKNMPLVRSTAEQSMQRAAEAQAAMYSNLGRTLGNVANTYFEKKEEDKQIDAITRDERILNMIYRDKTDEHGNPVMPSDLKEVRSDVKALYKGMGGRKGIEQLMRLDSAEQRADWAFNQAKQKDEAVSSYLKAITGGISGGDVSSRISVDGANLGKNPYSGLSRGELNRQKSSYEKMLGGRAREDMTPEAINDAQQDVAYIKDALVELDFTGEVPTPRQSLLARSGSMTGQSYLEAFMLENPEATAGMQKLAYQTAANMPQREPQPPRRIDDGDITYFIDPVTQAMVGSPIVRDSEENFERKEAVLGIDESLRDIDRIEALFIKQENEEDFEAPLVGPDAMDRLRRFGQEELGFSGLSEYQINKLDQIKQFIASGMIKASTELKGSISEGELKLLKDTAPKETSNPQEWQRWLGDVRKKLQRTKQLKTNGMPTGISEAGMRGEGGTPIDISPDKAYVDFVNSSDFFNQSPERQATLIERFKGLGLPQHVTESVINELDAKKKINEAGGGGSSEVPAPRFPGRKIPSVAQILNSTNDEAKAEILKVLTNVMIEGRKSGELKDEDFEGSLVAWHKQHPDPQLPSNYETLIKYADKSMQNINSAARNWSSMPLPTDDTLFELLEDIADEYQ